MLVALLVWWISRETVFLNEKNIYLAPLVGVVSDKEQNVSPDISLSNRNNFSPPHPTAVATLIDCCVFSGTFRACCHYPLKKNSFCSPQVLTTNMSGAPIIDDSVPPANQGGCARIRRDSEDSFNSDPGDSDSEAGEFHFVEDTHPVQVRVPPGG